MGKRDQMEQQVLAWANQAAPQEFVAMAWIAESNRAKVGDDLTDKKQRALYTMAVQRGYEVLA